MIGVKPSVTTDPPLPAPFPLSFNPDGCKGFMKQTFCKKNPFPCKFNHMKIEKWLLHAKDKHVSFTDLRHIVRDAGHMDLDQLQHIQVLILAMGLPPPPPF